MALWDKLLHGGADKDEKKAQEHWESAVKYFEGKLYNRALKDMTDALALNPDLARDAMELMHSFSTSDNDEMALSIGLALLKLEPANTELINKLGNSLRKTNSFAKAKKIYTHALKINPKHTEARYNLAACSFRITVADSELVSQTRRVEAYVDVRRYEFLGSRTGFFPVPNQSLDGGDAAPKQAEGEGEEEVSDEARAQMMEGQIQELKADVESSEGSADARFNLALFYDLNGLGDLAIQNYREALEKEPENRMASNNLGVALLVHSENVSGAESTLLKNLESHPFDRTTVLNLALVYRKLSKGFQTLKYFVYLGDLLGKSLGDFETDKVEQHAYDLFGRRKYLEAVPVMENLALEKQEPVWYEKLAVMYANQKKEDKLIYTWKRLLRISPEHEEAAAKLTGYAENYEEQARERLQKDNRRQAIELFLKAVQIEETPERWVELAQLYQDEGEEILADNALRRWKKLTGVGEPQPEGDAATAG